MKIIHTSDWHLGATLAGHERLAEQRLFLQWLLDMAVTQRVDAVLVAGDVYDTVNPPVEAQRLFAWFQVELRRLLPHASLVATAGNHDSAARLEASHPYTDALGNLHLVGAAAIHGDHCLLGLPDSSGGFAAWCIAMPFLRAVDLDCRLQENETPDQAFARSVRALYARLLSQAKARNAELPVIAMAHCTVGGAEHAGSERILIGGVESVPVDAISNGADYVALGHIHRPQRLGSDQVRYCGSPYAMDCDERKYSHQVLLATLGAAGETVEVESIAVPEFVPLLSFPTQGHASDGWQGLEAELKAFGWDAWRTVARDLQPLVELAPFADGASLNLRERVESLCAEFPFRLVRARWQSAQRAEASTTLGVDLSSRQAPEELFTRHYSMSHNGEKPSADLMRCFREAVSMAAIQEGL